MAEDKVLKCKQCGQQFIFTAVEQEFFAQKGFENEPARCAPCRRARKRERAATSGVHFRESQPFRDASSRPGYGRGRY